MVLWSGCRGCLCDRASHSLNLDTMHVAVQPEMALAFLVVTSHCSLILCLWSSQGEGFWIGKILHCVCARDPETQAWQVTWRQLTAGLGPGWDWQWGEAFLQWGLWGAVLGDPTQFLTHFGSGHSGERNSFVKTFSCTGMCKHREPRKSVDRVPILKGKASLPAWSHGPCQELWWGESGGRCGHQQGYCSCLEGRVMWKEFWRKLLASGQNRSLKQCWMGAGTRKTRT